MNSVVTTVTADHTLVITLDRPEKRNAIDAEVTAGLDEALNLLDDDPDLWVGILTGSQGVFCAGTDLLNGPGDPTERGGRYGVMRRRRGTPLIAAVEGYAYGGGLEVTMACDLVVAARTARFALPETARGVIANSGALFMGPRALPRNVLHELLLTARPLEAERAYSLGFVNRLVETGQALDEARALAGLLCEQSPAAQRETLLTMELLRRDADDAGWLATDLAVERHRASADFREGIEAFRDKRSPRWTNR